MADANPIESFKKKYLVIKNETFLQFFAELFGTFLLVTMVDYGVAMGILGRSANPIVQIAFGNGLGVMLAVYVAGGISGGHLNPAVSFAFFVVGKMTFVKWLMFTSAQYIGGFLGAAMVYLQYHEIIHAYADGQLLTPGAVNATSQIFATYPHQDISVASGLLDQVIGTGTLVIAIFSFVDSRNAGVSSGMIPLLIGLTVTMLVASTAMLTQTSLNPARDFSPRILTFVVGYGTEVFSYRNYSWFLIPLFGPYLGAFLAAWIYEIFFGMPLEYRERLKSLSEETSVNIQNPSRNADYAEARTTSGSTNPGYADD